MKTDRQKLINLRTYLIKKFPRAEDARHEGFWTWAVFYDDVDNNYTYCQFGFQDPDWYIGEADSLRPVITIDKNVIELQVPDSLSDFRLDDFIKEYKKCLNKN